MDRKILDVRIFLLFLPEMLIDILMMEILALAWSVAIL